MLTKANQEAARHRIAAKNAADEAVAKLTRELGKALGLVKDDDPLSPEQLTQQLTAEQQKTAQKEAAAHAAALELAIYKAANARKLNADELLDSRTFMARANEIDPTDTGALDALLTEVASGSTRFKAAPVAPAAGGADLGPGGSAAPRIYSSAQLANHEFYKANREDIMMAIREGRIRE